MQYALVPAAEHGQRAVRGHFSQRLAVLEVVAEFCTLCLFAGSQSCGQQGVVAEELAQLAQQLGVTRQTVNAIELGKYSPSLEVAFKIAAVFELPLEEVFQFQAKKKG